MSNNPKHTPEPWSAPAHVVFSAGGSFVATCYREFESTVEDGIPNARRIVGCVNACAGIPTETLEAGVRIEAGNDKTQVWVNPKVPDDELA